MYIRGGAPAGTYSCEGFIGDYPGGIIDSSSFNFSKVGIDPGDTGDGEWFSVLNSSESSTENAGRTENSFLLSMEPNPFNSTTVISYQLPVVSHVNLSVFDVAGRRVTDLIDGWREAGYHEVTFNGSSLASGVYVCRLEASGSGTTPTTVTGKMVLLK
jgi:hypothetical protein